MNSKKIGLAIILFIATVGALALMPPGALTLRTLHNYQALLTQWLAQHPFSGPALFFAIYVATIALSIPIALVLTLLAGAVFPYWQSVLLVSFASTLGSLLAMLASRYLLSEWIMSRFPQAMAAVNRGIKKDGAFYLLALRLTPLFPFFLVNLLAGLTRLSALRFWWISQLGMLPATLIYLNAGRQLRQLRALNDILSPGMLLALTLIGILPLASRWLLRRFTSS